MAFQFYGRAAEMTAEQTWTLHVSGLIRLNQAMPDIEMMDAVAHAHGEIFRADSFSGEATPKTAHYHAMQQRDLDYGPSFQGVGRTWQRDNAVRAELEFPQMLQAEGQGYQLHPALLDACFQLNMALADDSLSGAYLPVTLDNLVYYRRPQAYERLTAIAVRQLSGELLTGDVYLMDDSGQLLMAARGLSLQRLERHDQEETDHWLYEAVWEPQPPIKQSSGSAAGSWLIFADEGGTGQASSAAPITSFRHPWWTARSAPASK